MNIVTRNPKFFWALIAFLVLGSLWEMYPLNNQSLIQEFRDQADAASQDAVFRNIVSNADWPLEKTTVGEPIYSERRSSNCRT